MINRTAGIFDILIPMLIIFAIVGGIHGLFYAIWGDDIFEYNIDNDAQEDWFKKRKEKIKEAPRAWRIEHFLHRFIGVFLGWIILWFLIDERLHAFSSFKNYSFSLGDLILFILGYVGINGRLPSIPHTITDWFVDIKKVLEKDKPA